MAAFSSKEKMLYRRPHVLQWLAWWVCTLALGAATPAVLSALQRTSDSFVFVHASTAAFVVLGCGAATGLVVVPLETLQRVLCFCCCSACLVWRLMSQPCSRCSRDFCYETRYGLLDDAASDAQTAPIMSEDDITHELLHDGQ
jgi:hypothetical protein